MCNCIEELLSTLKPYDNVMFRQLRNKMCIVKDIRFTAVSSHRLYYRVKLFLTESTRRKVTQNVIDITKKCKTLLFHSYSLHEITITFALIRTI